ncbi:hypothetical protein Ahy_B06g081811 isoform B [Arachis hypogaea]|uniref:CCHC-type domain-containing protein n=1 Tax=Arachis hypogaea TaxID=3818 RepID=A0A444YLY8_ARAHY|nr:hypothetical protein Ahy_B06g081811 isoform B [Arachis hypogaea]
MLRRPRICRQCGAKGHSHSRCRQASGANADNDAHQNKMPCIMTCTGVPGMQIPSCTVRYYQNHEAKARTSSAQMPQTYHQTTLYQIIA